MKYLAFFAILMLIPMSVAFADESTPTDLTATIISSTLIELSWNPPSETFGQSITGYEIKRIVIDGVYDNIGIVDKDTHTFTVNDLIPNKAYTFVVSANVGFGSTGNSNSVSISSSGAEPEPTPSAQESQISIQTDKSSYSEGETILITGEVRDLYSGTKVSVVVIAPNGNLVSISQTIPGTDKKFSNEVTAGGSLMRTEGNYKVEVKYGTEERSATTSFYFAGTTASSSHPNQNSSVISDGKATVMGTSNVIEYEINGGKLINIREDVDFKSLNILIDFPKKGSITLELPRAIIDSKYNGIDDRFIVIVDGDDKNYSERKSSSHRTMTIPIDSGSEEIEIIGSHLNEKPIKTESYQPAPKPEIPRNTDDGNLRNENIRLQNKIISLEDEQENLINDNYKLNAENKRLTNQNNSLNAKITELQNIINEQIKVILETLQSMK